ncbi:cytochrome P450 6B7-like isoform X2 [Homarus americanus]|uniref:cytochrome P450 6B7-like isoform X2 n=1 Tax=Homarus americanus TaxID=6706 RepID=UPI001C46F5CD|nr:cytochrome P450 6B7-like isoform X2 [Homarus americanus]
MIAQIVSCVCTFPLIVPIIVVLFLVGLYLQKIYSFWETRGVQGPKPTWIIGNMYARLRATHSMAEFDQMLYKNHGGKTFCGYYEFTQPCLMVGDPELLKHIMVKDFDHFTDRSFVTFNEPVMDHMLLGLKGGMWKAVRSVMTPTFSSGKIKQTLQLVKDCAKNLITYFDKELEKRSSVFEMKEVYGMFTMDTIASIAFGVNSDSLNSTQNEFSQAAASFFKPPPKWKRPFIFFQFLWPQIAKYLCLNVIDRTPIYFFTKVVSDTMKYRLQNNLRRNDFLQLLLDARLQEQTNNNKGSESADLSSKKVTNQVLTDLVITAQCVLFYMAGYDTTATTLSFLSYCLALHPDIQQKCMQEIETVLEKHEGEITYEAIMEMTYLDMVFAETLRLYPPAPRVDRTVTKDFTLPGTNLILHKGQKVSIPIYRNEVCPDGSKGGYCVLVTGVCIHPQQEDSGTLNY